MVETGESDPVMVFGLAVTEALMPRHLA